LHTLTMELKRNNFFANLERPWRKVKIGGVIKGQFKRP